MKMSNRHRRFHDPWGSRGWHENASIIAHQWRVGRTDLEDSLVNKKGYMLDGTKYTEWTRDRFVLGSHSVESTRR